MIYTNSNPNRQRQFETSFGSVMEHTPASLAEPLHFHFCADSSSEEPIKREIEPHMKRLNKGLKNTDKQVLAYTLYYIKDIEKKVVGLKPLLKKLEQFFTSGGHVSGTIFFLGPWLHMILPESAHRAVQLDVDIKLKASLRELEAFFDSFKKDSFMGLAYDGQPVYRHVMWKYRQQNPKTKIGNPPATGFAGYNSGVMLLWLDRMRTAGYANVFLNTTHVDALTTKYSFKGHLGDQDWLTLIGAEHRRLIHLLPCQWNRQLCEYWKAGYAEVWDDYHGCEPPIKLWHGNCNTPFPEGV